MKIILLIFFLLSLCCCHSKQNEFDDDFYDEISLYSDTVVYRALMIFPAEQLNHNPDIRIDGYVIGPCMVNILKDQKSLLLNSKSGKHIYIITDLSCIFKNAVYPTNDDNVEIDSVFLYKDYENKSVYTKEQIICYLKNAKMLYKMDGKWNWNCQPDTLFLPKIIISR